jgi:two-component system, chemotaxis family, CheB/CheR fusion protein
MHQATSLQRELHASFPVIGIGAATGGLRALQQFFAAMPPTNGMVFVVMVQPSSRAVRHIVTVLQDVTTMPVQALAAPVQLAVETIYIVSPTQSLLINDLLIEPVALDRENTNGSNGVIDRLFRVLAEAYSSHAACIVLSGDGADGAVGIAQVKEVGGLIFAQDPQEAECPAMPQNAINTGASDFVLPVAAMPEHLLTLWNHEKQLCGAEGALAPLVDEPQIIEETLRTILATVYDRTGYDFTQYQRQAVLRRIERRMLITLQPDLPAYNRYLYHQQAEAQLLRDDLLVSVTCFFRNHSAYNALARTVVPLLFAGKTGRDTVRAWVAGCASGEEAYSLAMVLLEYAATLPDPPGIQIFASDVNEVALQAAREGCYPESIAIDVAPARLRRLFQHEKQGYRISAAVRDRVVFAQHNVLVDTPFVRLDLVSCRNVLSYLTDAAQERVVNNFQFALRPGGFLFLGSAEAIDAVNDRFTPFDTTNKLFRTKAVAAIQRTMPVVPLQVPTMQVQAPPASSPQSAAPTAFDRMHLEMLQRHQSASIIVNAAFELVHLSDNAGRFMQLSDGTRSFNLFTMARPELRDALRLALIQAAQTNQSVESRRIRLEHGDSSEFVSIRVYPERDPSTQVWFALVLFDVVERTLGIQPAQDSAVEAHIQALEADLLQLYEEMSAANDPVAAALRISNEALYASNEELRVLTEQLETNKEVLQALNEELQIVNQELGYRVDKLSVINDDLTNLIAAAHIAIVFLDRKLKITRFTPEAASIFSLIHTDEGRPLAHLTHRLDYADLLTDAQSVLQTAQPIEREIGSHDDQSFLVRIAPYHTARRWNAGVVLRFVDITARKQAEDDLARAYAAEQAARATAERALHVRDQFLSIASHELRTPMTALLGYAQMLRRALQGGKGDVAKMADRVIRQTQRLDSLVDQLLDVSRLQRGQFVLERQPVDLNALGAYVVAEFRETLPAAAARAVSFVPEDSAAPVMVHADPARIEQVMLNLLSNAVKYSPPRGTVHLRLRQTATEAVLKVVDEGIGVPEHVRQQIFQPFFRAENIDVQVSGFGLGLYIVQNIVERHDGTIVIESHEGVGSTFRISLPLCAANDQGLLDSKAEQQEE